MTISSHSDTSGVESGPRAPELQNGPAAQRPAIKSSTRDRDGRCAAVNELYRRLLAILDARARVAAAAGIPAGETGLFVPRAKIGGAGENRHVIRWFEIDVSPVTEMRKLVQTARRLIPPGSSNMCMVSILVSEAIEKRRKRDAAERANALGESGPEPTPSEPEAVDRPIDICTHIGAFEALQDLCSRVLLVMEGRSHAEHVEYVPGAQTGLLNPRVRMTGAREGEHVSSTVTLDRRLLREFEVLLQAIEELDPAPKDSRSHTEAIIAAMHEGREERRRERHRQACANNDRQEEPGTAAPGMIPPDAAIGARSKRTVTKRSASRRMPKNKPNLTRADGLSGPLGDPAETTGCEVFTRHPSTRSPAEDRDGKTRKCQTKPFSKTLQRRTMD